jgi:hypothetical protein
MLHQGCEFSTPHQVKTEARCAFDGLEGRATLYEEVQMATNRGKQLTSAQQNAIQEAEKILNEASAKARSTLANAGLDYPDDESAARPCAREGCNCEDFKGSYSDPMKCRCGHHWGYHPLPR